MNQNAQYQLNKSNEAIDNLDKALGSIEFYKDKIEQALYILKNFKIGNEQTGELSSHDSEFLRHVSFMAKEFDRDEELNGNTTLSVFASLEDSINQYSKVEKSNYELAPFEDDGYHD